MSPSITSNGGTTQVPKIPLAYNPKDSEPSAQRLVDELYPEWKSSPGEIEFVPFKDGITNTLFKAVKKRPGYSEQQIDDEAILLRAYGNDTDLIIDRNREAHSHSLLAKYELAPPLLARFENGLLYGFIPGDPCLHTDFHRRDVFPSIARLLAEWHATLLPEEAISQTKEDPKPYQNVLDMTPGHLVPNLWTVMQKWIQVLRNDTEEEKKRNATLQREFEYMAKRFHNLPGLSNGRYVSCHCDLLCGNVIMLPEHKQSKTNKEVDVAFIDYEYITPGPQAFDCANHLAEWAGFDCDFTVVPTVPQRRAWITEYVKSYRKHERRPANGDSEANGKSNRHDENADIERLYKEVEDLRGLPGLYWGIWALIQSMISDIDFDYVTYADRRFSEYWAWKAEDDGSRARDGKELPVRERRWQQTTWPEDQ